MHLNGVVVKIPAMIFPRPCRSKALAVLAQVESTRWATHDVISDTWRSANCSRMVCLVSPSGMGSVSGRTSKSQAVLSTACQEWPLQHVAEPHWPGATFVGSMKTLPGSTALLQSRTSVFLLGTDDVCELVQSCQRQKTKSSDPRAANQYGISVFCTDFTCKIREYEFGLENTEIELCQFCHLKYCCQNKAYLFWVANQSGFVAFYALEPSNTSLITKTFNLLSSTCSSSMLSCLTSCSCSTGSIH